MRKALDLGKEQDAIVISRAHTEALKVLAIRPRGKRIVSASADRTVRIWDGETGKQLAILRGHEQSVTSITLSPDGKWVASAGRRVIRVKSLP